MRTHCIIGIVLLGLGLPATSLAQARETRSIKRAGELVREGNALKVSMGFEEIFTAQLSQRLKDGFLNRVVVEIFLKSKDDDLLALAGIQLRVRWILFEDVYRVEQTTESGTQRFEVANLEQLKKRIGGIRNIPLVARTTVPAGTVCQLVVRVTVNPPSEEELKRILEHLSNPNGRAAVGSPRSFFGSFSKIFFSARDIQADGVYTLQSPSFVMPAGS